MESDKDWIAWGEADPFWAVATADGREKSGARPWTPEEFYANGTANWVVYKRLWSAYGLNTAGTCLEIGCGAGRVSQALAKDFAKVECVDVSPAMLDVARRYVTDSNIAYHLTSGTRVPVEVGAVDAVLSTFVFQHLETTADGVEYFRSIFGTMRPGATMMVQLPAYALPAYGGSLEVSFRWMLELQIAGQEFVARQRARAHRLRKLPVMRHLFYEMGELQAALIAIGYVDVQFTYSGPSTQWLFARRP